MFRLKKFSSSSSQSKIKEIRAFQIEQFKGYKQDLLKKQSGADQGNGAAPLFGNQRGEFV